MRDRAQKIRRIAEVNVANTKMLNFILLLDTACGTVSHWALIFTVPLHWEDAAVSGTEEVTKVIGDIYRSFSDFI